MNPSNSTPTTLETFLNNGRKKHNELLSELSVLGKSGFKSISQQYYDSLNELLSSPLLNLAETSAPSTADSTSDNNKEDSRTTEEPLPSPVSLCATAFFSGFNEPLTPQFDPLAALDLKSVVTEEVSRIFNCSVASASKSAAIGNCGLVYGIVAIVRTLDFGARFRSEMCEMCVKWIHEYSDPANARNFLLSTAKLVVPSIPDKDALDCLGDEMVRRKKRSEGIVILIAQLYIHGLFPPLWINYVFRFLLSRNVLVELVEENIWLASQLLKELSTHAYLDSGEFNETRQRLAIFDDVTSKNWPVAFSKSTYSDSLLFLEFRRGAFAEDILSGKRKLPSATHYLAEIVVIAALLDVESGFGQLGVDISNFIASILRALAPPSALCIPLEEISLMRLRLRFDRNFR